MKYTLAFLLLFLASNVSADVVSVQKNITTREPTVRGNIEAVFWNEPRMVSIVNCESGFNQFKNGKPLISRTSDVGVMQINQVHWKRAKSLGLDIFNSASDNIRMGKLILKEQGIKAWTCNRLV